MKCEDLQSTASGSQSCKVCREIREACTFNDPVRKRGPRPGWRLRAQNSPENAKAELGVDGGPDGARPGAAPGIPPPPKPAHPALSQASSSTAPMDAFGSEPPSPPPLNGQPSSRSRPRGPLMGLPTALVDQLLAVYFTHVHNVWPLIYKPMFHPTTTSPPLLLAMLAIAACVSPSPEAQEQSGLDKDKLFQMAESALHRCRLECRVDIIQSLILLSLRQTGCGDKHSAFTYAGRACCMALNLGLNLAPASYESPADAEVRSRVYWNCYVLDKSLAEETGRTFILPYRRSSTPLPSVNEVDEFETWPPLPTSALPLPRSVRHIVPRRGYVMSCFVWTCHLAMVVENILDLDVVGPPAAQDPNPWVQQFTASLQEERTGEAAIARADRIAGQLQGWRNALPQHLDVNLSQNVSPLPHHIVGLAWYHSAQILLHSRFIRRRHLFSNQDKTEEEMAARTHSTCSRAAESVIELLAHLDRHKLLSQTSSDVIHILSLATLFEAFDASDPNEALAERAKVNFAQCCIWLRDCSSSWPTASAHKLFFEGLIQGGLKLSNSDEAGKPGVSPSSSFVDSPSMPDGLRAVGRSLSVTDGMQGSLSLPPLGISSLFQLPQFYWNHLTNAIPGQSQPPLFQNLDTSPLGFMLGSPENNMGLGLPDWGSAPDARFVGSDKMVSLNDNPQQASPPGVPWDPSLGGGGVSEAGTAAAGQGIPYTQNLDPSQIYSVLMSFMVEAAKTQ